ncbi:hypothetical protein Moror_12348 [Moniliophthora roreri MCA 2997]|uniref:Uncharacterized protein n=1 Tax=Moniliophthora roreri (strain MCA 2997) TaxID=1381753 RepID=V2XTI6_MONRO|nr:hypothetical protein Moror_12348 [Moniliophthora roreri MCA 2997]
MKHNHSFFNAGLQSYATSGDYEGVQRALEAGANVNVFDASGRGALMCAIAGERWRDIESSATMSPSRVKIIQLLLEYTSQSLYALNAPQSSFNGVTPLGMAAWLNSPEAVSLLLDASSGSVDVDGMDSHGATPLMYAARDGNLEIVRILIQHGARPDFRDKNHRTSLQYAASHPQILRLCETALRHHRQHERQISSTDKLPFRAITHEELPEVPQLPMFSREVASQATKTLIQSIYSSDLSTLHSLLSSGSSTPSQLAPHIFLNQPDSNGWSPIHHCCSARILSEEVLDSLYCAGADVSLFTVKEQYTPLHCLARSGSAAAYSFAIHLIRNLRAPVSARDKHGDTCIHIAAEHGCSAEVLRAFLECDTTGRIREIRNDRGMTALDVAKPAFRVIFGAEMEAFRPESSLSISTIRPPRSFASFPSSVELHRSRETEDETVSISDFDIVTAAHQLIDNLRITSPFIHHDSDLGHLTHMETVLRESNVLGTAIIRYFRTRSANALRMLQDLNTDATQVADLHATVSRVANDTLLCSGLGDVVHARHYNRESEDSQLTAVSSADVQEAPEALPNEKSKVSDNKPSATSFFWGLFKRKAPAKLIQLKELDVQPIRPESNNSVTKSPVSPVVYSWLQRSAEESLRASTFVLEAADRDLSHINESLASAAQFLASTARSISRAERIITKALKRRSTMLANLRTFAENHQDDDLFIRPKSLQPSRSFEFNNYLSTKSSIASFSTISSVNSEDPSDGSFASIIAESDDEEVKAIRRSILRKIEARTDGALDEIDKIVPWLRVVKETIRGVKRRAYLNIRT